MMSEFDPDEILDNLRVYAARVTGGDPLNDGQDLAEDFLRLDEWLSKGGRPPAAWDPFSKQPAPTVTGRTYIRPPATPEQHARGTD